MKAAEKIDSILSFAAQENWAAWLEKNHDASSGVWLRLAKAAAKESTVTYMQAIEVALCYGWIDGQKKPDNEQYWLQRFTPRSTKSIWSKINKEKATALIENERMQLAGMQEIERARKDGRWEAAYASAKNATVPEDFQAALDANSKAKTFFATLNSQNRYAILFRIQTVKKAETRVRKISTYIEMLAKGEKLYP